MQLLGCPGPGGGALAPLLCDTIPGSQIYRSFLAPMDLAHTAWRCGVCNRSAALRQLWGAPGIHFSLLSQQALTVMRRLTTLLRVRALICHHLSSRENQMLLRGVMFSRMFAIYIDA
jgi:hypothetical protein